MAKRTERVAIGGVQYNITQLGADVGRGLRKKFLEAIGPLLREVISGPVFGDLQKAIEGATATATTPEETASVEAAGLRALQLLGPLMMRALESLPLELYNELCAVFAANSTVDLGQASNGQRIPIQISDVFDDHFAANYGALDAWLGHSIRVNSFLGMSGLGSASLQSATTA